MQRIIFLLALSFLIAQGTTAQPITWSSPETEQLYNTARTYLSNGNFPQAVASYQQLANLEPDQIMVFRDLAQALILSGKYDLADQVLSSVISRNKAIPDIYQLAFSSQIARGHSKPAKKYLEQGLQKFPRSGLLYHEYGSYYEKSGDPENALKQWLEGIKMEPAFRVNYYEAARIYMHFKQPDWAIVYGEIFINLERVTPRANETRKMIVAAYKQLFYSPDDQSVPQYRQKDKTPANSFITAMHKTYLGLAPVMADGLNVENLTMLRTRFIAAWTTENAKRFPFALFSYWDDLLRNGYFDAYNQWLFGRAINEQEYNSWVAFHPEAMPAYESHARTTPLQPATRGEYYNEDDVKKVVQNKKSSKS